MITIHCGLHKTGSSSIQLALGRMGANRDVRVFIPTEAQDDSTSSWTSRFDGLKTNSDAVLSDENLLGSPLDGYSRAPERLATLRQCLAGTDFRLVAYVRPQTDWLPSVYLQGVQQGLCVNPQRFWDDASEFPLLRWTNLVELLQRESGAAEIAVRAYTPGRDIVRDFFAVAGLRLPRALAKVPPRENVSITAAQAPLLALISELPGITKSEHTALRLAFQTHLRKGALEGASPFPPSVQAAISAEFRPDWEQLTAVITSAPSSDAEAFRQILEAWRSEPRPYAGASLDDAAIQAEALRSIRVLTAGLDTKSPTSARRLLNRLRNDPWGLPSATLGHLRRRT